MRNARFWITYRGDYVKLTMRPGQELEIGECHAHEEGWSSHSDQFSFDGITVTRDWSSDGTDCDGRLSQGGVLECRVDRLRRHVGSTDAPGLFPLWEQVGRNHQRDYAAEAMGY